MKEIAERKETSSSSSSVFGRERVMECSNMMAVFSAVVLAMGSIFVLLLLFQTRETDDMLHPSMMDDTVDGELPMTLAMDFNSLEQYDETVTAITTENDVLAPLFLWSSPDEASCAPLADSQQRRRRRLELLHIPKTGGTDLEVVAAQHNVTWGACHWVHDLEGQKCPPHPDRERLFHSKYHVSFWHLPMQLLDEGLNPYQDADVFAVVRDPYARLVSQWNYKNLDVKDLAYDRNNPHHLNQYLQAILRIVEDKTSASAEYFIYDGHFIPQYDYIHNQEIAFVLRTEHIADDFACLMKHYGMTPQFQSLPPDHFNAAYGRLTEANLTHETRELIERVYEKDFVFFGYEKWSQR